ncbi:MAG: hypothetical protein BWK73_10685 [Thiothrix lacustris]|uniref:CopG family transcriptional regulator n=1 Tax=Thiothrix lacustris TaxID=525917 RepID=A0A1Y1QUD0_9GAMM|nr:MAG: hypothetical protein BWK73_10685 [Thiothrix lacustris]
MKEDYDFSDGMRGAIIRTDKVNVNLWLSLDVVQWFRDKAQDDGSFQDLINEALEAHIQQQKEANPHKRKPYKLAELLEGCDPDAPMPEEAREWDNMPPVGNEII